jgi:hypothetical protein
MDSSLQEFLADEVADYRAMVREHGYRPPKWTMPEPSRDLLRRLCRRFPAAPDAFEFGSGRTTAALRSVCRGVVSVDDSAAALQKTEELSGQVPRRGTDLTAVIPLSRCWIKLVPCRSFSLKKRPELVERLAAADLILVDRPVQPAARGHVLLTALRHAKVGALIVLDDLDVEATLAFAERLARDNRAALGLFVLPIDHIVGVFQKTAAAKIAWRPSLRGFIGSWRTG